MRSFIAAVLSIGFSLGCAWGAIKGETVEYKAGETTLKGYLAYDDAIKGKRPGLMVVHEWWGLNEYPKRRARMLAALGYTALAVDMYGDGKVAHTPDEAKVLSGQAFSDIAQSQARFQAAYDLLREHPTVDAPHLGVVGYCFGGGMALQMVRAGFEFDGAVSVHGSLATQRPAQPGKIKAKILAQTGGADPVVPVEQVKAFEEEMTLAEADAHVIVYPGAKHAFTNPEATELGKKFKLPTAYDAGADKKSWTDMRAFLKEVFK